MDKIAKEMGGSTNTIRMVSALLQGHAFPYLSGLVKDLSALNDEQVNDILKAYFGGEFLQKK